MNECSDYGERILSRLLVIIPIAVWSFCAPAKCATPNSPGAIAIVDVNVVPMDRNTVLPHQTVVVRDGRIAEIGPTGKVVIPKHALAIDGARRYLIPGLTDFHLHMPDTEQDRRDELTLLYSNGITAAVNMRGTPEVLAIREQIRRGELTGPTIYSTGPYINEPEYTSPEQVKQAVVAQKRAGYDFIKVHGELAPDVYAALIATAREQHMPVLGHVPVRLGIDAVLGNHSLIVHAEEFLYSYFQRNRDLATDPGEIDRMVKEIAVKVARSGTWVSPTLATFREIIYQVSDLDSVLQRPAMRYVPPDIAAGWQAGKNPYLLRFKVEKVPYFRAQYAIMRALTKGLRDAGVPLLAGTDCLVSGVIPGFSMQDELDDLTGAGLLPYEALRAATVNAATFLGTSGSSGTVRAGNHADLILLDANPLEDITNVSRRAGVMLHGKWLAADDLQRDLSRLARKYDLLAR